MFTQYIWFQIYWNIEKWKNIEWKYVHSKIIFLYSAWFCSWITGTIKVGGFIESKILVYFTSTTTSLKCYS